MAIIIDWSNQDDFPEEMQNDNISVDVLVWCPKSDTHTIGWFHFKQMEWLFLCREVNYKNFKWRYFTDDHDRTNDK